MEEMWQDIIVLKNTRKYAVVEITSSALKFKMKANHFVTQTFQLISDRHENICNVMMQQQHLGIVVSMQMVYCRTSSKSKPLNLDLQEYQEFWLTWFNGIIQMGKTSDYVPFVSLKVTNIQETLKYVQFDTNIQRDVELIIEVSPIHLKETDYKILDDADLRWESVQNQVIPLDAIVGGFENEPLYIARADHNNSLCPGKYVRSEEMAFVPWGGRAHPKSNFEVLCGYDYKWVKSKGSFIPENAFVAGHSEVHDGPLYVARAIYDGYLITGKVHTLYGTCYLPYQGKEIEVGEYEILVKPSVIPRGYFFETS